MSTESDILIQNLIQQATTIEKGPPSTCLTYNTEIKRLDPKKLVELVVQHCAQTVTTELAVFDIDGDFLLGQFGISKQ